MFKNNFVNDGNFLEQFKRMKDSTTSAKQEPVKIEPKIQVKPENDSKNSNDWYQAALERAKNIAKSMSKDVKSEGKFQLKNSHCEIFMIFLSLKFYMKSILENLEVPTVPIFANIDARKFG